VLLASLEIQCGKPERLLRLPTFYAVLLALLFNYFGWILPLPLERSVDLLANATIPVLMVLMGIQLQASKWTDHTLVLSLGNLLRLLAAPAIALGLALIFHLEGAAFQAGIVEAAMPTAVFMTVLATEYDIEPAFITTAVFTSTLLSPLTLTPILALLGAMFSNIPSVAAAGRNNVLSACSYAIALKRSSRSGGFENQDPLHSGNRWFSRANPFCPTDYMTAFIRAPVPR
jgi:hypothetical protein